MIRALLTLAIFIFTIPAFAQGEVRVSIIRTGSVKTLEKFVFTDGSLLKQLTLNHSAVLVDHPKARILFDTGLGEQIDRQFSADMPWWGHLIFSYNKEKSAFRQLQESRERLPDTIILSHSHWDHGSGLPDFAGIPVWLQKQEADFLGHAHPGAAFHSQFVDLAGRQKLVSLQNSPVGSYGESLDIFGDGKVILVGMPGHTPGSVGMLVQTSSGKKLFFVGDVVWSSRALANGSPKFWLPSRVVDHDRAATQEGVLKLRQFMQAHPDVVIIPAHDAEAQDRLGYFPHWIE